MSKQYLQQYTAPDAHPTDIFSIAVTPTHILTASGSSSIKIYSARGQTIHNDSAEEENPYPHIQTLENIHKLGCHHIVASLDGRVSASVGFGGEVSIHHLDDTTSHFHEQGIIPATSQAGEHWAPALNSTGQFLALTTHTGSIHVHDLSTLTRTTPPTLLTTYETKGIFGTALDIAPDGESTASGHANGTITLFNNTTRRLTHSLSTGTSAAVRAVKFSPANTLLAATGDARVIALFDARSGEQVAALAGHGAWVLSVDWNWSGEFLVSGAWDGRAKVWSVERRECVATQTEGERAVWAVRWLVRGAADRNEIFVAGGAGRGLAFYREASGT